MLKSVVTSSTPIEFSSELVGSSSKVGRASAGAGLDFLTSHACRIRSLLYGSNWLRSASEWHGAFPARNISVSSGVKSG